jgi:hypothetical protein
MENTVCINVVGMGEMKRTERLIPFSYYVKVGYVIWNYVT